MLNTMLNKTQLEVSDHVTGKGEFGTVLKGLYCGTRVAIKKLELPENSTPSDKDDLQFDMEKEIELLSKLRHPNILKNQKKESPSTYDHLILCPSQRNDVMT